VVIGARADRIPRGAPLAGRRVEERDALYLNAAEGLLGSQMAHQISPSRSRRRPAPPGFSDRRPGPE
jgi:hypothetical protein